MSSNIYPVGQTIKPPPLIFLPEWVDYLADFDTEGIEVTRKNTQGAAGRPLDTDQGRAMRDAVVEAGEPLTAGEISAALGLSRKAAHGLLERREDGWTQTDHGRWHPRDLTPALLTAREWEAVRALRGLPPESP